MGHTILRLSKKRSDRFFDNFLRPTAAHSPAAARAAGSHVCGPRCIFSDVHAAGKNDNDPFAPFGAKLCEAFLTS